MVSPLTAVLAPVIGFCVVLLAYCLGIYLSVKCCRPSATQLEFGTSRNLFEPHGAGRGVDIFIVSRSDDYVVTIPRRQTVITPAYAPIDDTIPTPAPAYEEPPTYEDCVRNGIA